MSDAEQPGASGEVPLPLLAPDTDWFLRALVEMVTGNDMEVGVTLHVGGFLVSGLLVDGAKYFEAFANSFAGAFPGPDASLVLEAFMGYRDLHTRAAQANPHSHYIHLKNTRFHQNSGAPIPTNEGVWWRGRLTEVSGFHLGNFSVDTQQSGG